MSNMEAAYFYLYSAFKGMFAMILLAAIGSELHALLGPIMTIVLTRLVFVVQPLAHSVSSILKDFAAVARDYRSGVYYIPFKRASPIIIRSPDAMLELSEAPQLSQRAVYADIFGFKHTMSHSVIQLDPNEQTNLRYRLFARAIRINGVSQLENLSPYLQARLEETVAQKMDPQLKEEGWNLLQIAPIMRDFATGMMGVYFFGETLCAEPNFSYAMSRYYDDTIKLMGALQIIPKPMQHFVHSLITNKGKALDVLFERLHRAVDPMKPDWNESTTLRPLTLFHNMIEASAESSYWTHTLIIQAVLGIWFAASHQPWINLHFVFLELCARPEYTEMIRQEIRSIEHYDPNSLDSLPILDSFIKEAVRVNPLDKMGIRRKAMQPYTFSNGGPHASIGDIVCVPSWDILHNGSKYPNPESFDGLRFVKDNHSETSPVGDGVMRGTTFTDASKDFPIWGLGSKVCPGRWHSSHVMKMVLVHLIVHYDFRLEADVSAYRWFWESFQMPYESSRVLFRRREPSRETRA